MRVRIKRFEPSQEAIDSINILQKTPWKINFRVARAIINLLKLRVEQFEQSLKIRFTQSGPVIDYIHPEGKFLEYDGGQLREWMENLDLALLKSLDNDLSSIFWHPWQFDWRGLCILAQIYCRHKGMMCQEACCCMARVCH